METATHKGVVDVPEAQTVDPMRVDFEAGVLSIRAIASKYKLSDTAIRKRAKKANPPWEYGRCRAQVDEMARQIGGGSQDGSQFATGAQTANLPALPDEAVEAAGRSIVQVVREHRGAIQAGQQLVGFLLGQLQDAAMHRGRLEDVIREDTAQADGEGNEAASATRRRATLMRAVSLPQHASTMKDLALAMKHLVGMERQAFGLADLEKPAEPTEATVTPAQDDDFLAIRRKVAERLGLVIDVESRQAAAA